jgi:hypothetical protein
MMISVALLHGVVALSMQVAQPDTERAPADTMSIRPTDSVVAPPLVRDPRLLASGGGGAGTVDTVRRRPRAIEVSDSYEMRLRIHRYASYATVPLFALQTIAGNQMYVNGGPTPEWANTLHKTGAAGLGALFTVNTVTGVWNLWETRGNEVGRTRRLLHAGFMLASDAGFAYAGIKLSGEAKRSRDGQIRHRRMAYLSMSSALAGYGLMLFGEH